MFPINFVDFMTAKNKLRAIVVRFRNISKIYLKMFS